MANNFSSNAHGTEPPFSAHTDIVACLLMTQSGHAACAGECVSTNGNSQFSFEQ